MPHLSYWKVLTRRKTLTIGTESDTKLNRVLGTFDLTALGVGATLGVGVYVLAGHVARDQAGPSVVLSFAIAALASLFAGICYAEFGARVPKAGSAYIYSYVCIGEFAAFVIGWNLILEYIIGSASVSKGLSLYLDTLINNTFRTTFQEIAPIGWEFLGSYFDFFAFGAAFLLGVALAFGLQKSTKLNNSFTVLNVGIVIFVIIAGSINANINNWKIDPKSLPDETKNKYNIGGGGFFPFGFEGTLKGAATCFFGFVGFDCIATTGEEVKNPRKAIPKSILFSLFIIFLGYFGVSTVLTLMWPYYLQDINAPLPFVFHEIGWPVAQWIVTVGGLFGLVASLFGAMFPLPRIIYAMSEDGLVFRFLGEVSPKFKTPVVGTLCAAALTGLMAAVFELTQLVNMLSIGTLLAYTVVAISITILRFMDNNTEGVNRPAIDANEGSNLMSNESKMSASSMLAQIINLKRITSPNTISTRTVGILLLFYCVLCFAISVILMYASQELSQSQPWALAVTIILIILLLFTLLAISIQPREPRNSVFTVPFVPFIPGISIFVNIYLMLQLDIYTWIRFAIWMLLGLPIYIASSCMYNRKKITNSGNLSDLHINGKINETEIENSEEIKNGIISHFEPVDDDIMNSEISNVSLDTIEDNAQTEQQEPDDQQVPPLTPCSVKSMDEIIPESELGDTVREMKNANGKTFFIEENPSPTPKTPQPIDKDEEESTVIAILDDVLHIEETSHLQDIHGRKVSIDSEQIPSFIETHTIAMIHNSCDDLKEYENEDEDKEVGIEKSGYFSEISCNEEETTKSCIVNEFTNEVAILDHNENIESNHLKHKIIEIVPAINEIIVDPYSGENILEQCEREATEQKYSEGNHESRNETNPTSTPISRFGSRKPSISESTISETNSPFLRSKQFLERLSLLIAQPPPTMARFKKQDDAEPTRLTSEEIFANSPYSDSKNDDQNHMQNNNEFRFDQKSSVEFSTEENFSSDNENENFNNNSMIPKPPKFDPVLYNTVSAKHQPTSRARPKLSTSNPDIEIINKPEEYEMNSPASPQSAEGSPTNEPMQFKAKLEEILKRGPSGRIVMPLKTSNKVSTERTTEEIENHSIGENNISSDKIAGTQDIKFENSNPILSSSENNSSNPSPPISAVNLKHSKPKRATMIHASTIEEALTRLRSIPEGIRD